MPNYYQNVLGNLNVGDIAKSSDIHHIQRHIQDALKALLSDLHNRESYVLGTDLDYKNSFVLTAAPKQSGRYIDSSNVFEEETDCFNINLYDVKQPILKTKSSLYSIITKMKNTSNRDIPVICQIQDENGTPYRTNTITLLKNTPSANYEIIFDLDYYPAPPNLDYEDLKHRDGKDIPARTKEESFDEGYKEEHKSEAEEKKYFSAGIPKLYFVIKRLNLNAVDLADNGEEEVVFDPENSLGVYCKKDSAFPDKEIFAEINGDKYFSLTDKNIYYQDVYANEMTYLCSGGEAVIDGEKITCLDTHVCVEGGSSNGNVLTQVYLGSDGHLHSANKKVSTSTDISEFEDDLDDSVPIENLPIALILTYSNAQYGTSKEPLIIQDSYKQLPRSHHERLRRLEKQMDWSNDIALPSRIKYTLSDGEWVDSDGENFLSLPNSFNEDLDNVDIDSLKKSVDTLNSSNIFLTPDEHGNIVVKLSKAKTETIKVTLKEKLKDSDGKEIKLKNTDVLNASSFSKVEHMVHDSKKGVLKLDTETKKNVTSSSIATTEKEAKLTKFNPWDDAYENRPKNKNIEKNEREYKVISGRNDENDRSSSYPGMTFYTETRYKLHKLNIPIHKFKNCSGVKFYIYKRQDENDKENTVWLQELVYSSKTFSLKKAKVKGNKQYVDEGFTINFGNGGLSLPKGQYVIIALAIPKGESGSLYVETYKPKNSKDFCIRYYGSSNAEHFRLYDRYQEVWYNSASVTVSEESYNKKGTVISKTLNFTGSGLEKIKSVKPLIGTLTHGSKSKDDYELYVSTGGKWIKVTPNKNNPINSGGATTFKWKLVFKGDGKSTPQLKYNSKKGYAIKFLLTRERPGAGTDWSKAEDYNKNMCITSKAIKGDSVLKEYLGDMNFGLDDNRFEGFEFARVWADNNENQDLLIDIQASDRTFDYNLSYQITENGQKKTVKKSIPIDLWSLHYCDLTLDDFEKISVDYSDYTTELEYDENNMRLKLDSEHSYNDTDIQLLSLKDFSKQTNDIDSDEESEKLTFIEKESVTENQIFTKKTFESPIDLTKYTGLKFNFTVDSQKNTSALLKGLGIYISSAEETDAPSNKKNLPETIYKDDILYDTDIIPAVIDPDESSYPYYEGKLIEIKHEIDPNNDGNKIYKSGFYQYIQEYDSDKEKYVWKRQQVFDLRSYYIFELGDIRYFDDDTKFTKRLEIDQDSNIFKNVKEIGIVSLNDEEKYHMTDDTIQTKMSSECTTSGIIKVTLKDLDDNLQKEKDISITITPDGQPQSTTITKKTDATNAFIEIKKTDDGLTDKGKVFLKFEGDKKTVNDKEVFYGGCQLEVQYDFSNNGKSITETVVKSFSAQDMNLQIDSIIAMNQDYVKIYDPSEKKTHFTVPNDTVSKDITQVKETGSLLLNNDTYQVGKTIDIDGYTTPKTTQICINHKKDNLINSSRTLCYVNNPFEEGLSNYRHIGIQLATDVYIPKDCLKINLCEQPNGVDPIASVNLPTMNTVYYPDTAGKNINLSQVFKKFRADDVKIKSISITTTPHFYDYMGKITNSNKPRVNLFIGNIVLYKARTIPIFHNKMRFKFYSTKDGEIEHFNSQMSDDSISVRKIGAVLDYH